MTLDDVHALLIRLDERTLKMSRVLEDNGQPGLVTRTAKLEAGQDVLESSVESLKSDARLLAWGIGVLLTAAGVVVAAIKL